MEKRTSGESTEKRSLGPWVSRKEDDEGWRGGKGEQGLALVLVLAPSRVEGTDRWGNPRCSLVEEERTSLKSDMESGRQGKGSESYGALLTSRLCEVSSGTKYPPLPSNLESRK